MDALSGAGVAAVLAGIRAHRPRARAAWRLFAAGLTGERTLPACSTRA